MTSDQVRKLIAAQVAEAGTIKAWADAHGVSPAYVGDTIKGRHEPAGKLLEALGLERVVTYRWAEQ
jgi:hypothetical protein